MSVQSVQSVQALLSTRSVASGGTAPPAGVASGLVAGVTDPLLAAALTASHDGVAATEDLDVEGIEIRRRRLDRAARDRADAPPRLPDPHHAAQALQCGLMQGVHLEAGSAGARIHARIRAEGPAPAGFDPEPMAILEMPEMAQFARQVAFVQSYGDLRDERLPEILVQLGDILSFFAAAEHIDLQRTPTTVLLLRAAALFAGAICQRIKLAFDAPRPVAFSSRVQPVIAMPSHGSLPSGHATEAFLLAGLLTLLQGGDPVAAAAAMEQRFRLAARIAVNRTVAGVHYPVDSGAGAVLGLALAEHLAAIAAVGAASPGRWRFAGGAWDDRDFHHGIVADLMAAAGADAAVPVARAADATDRAGDDLWAGLWRDAAAEHLWDGV